MMIRRLTELTIVAWCLLLPLGLFAPQQVEGAEASGKRPNILFAFADDWGRYASIYGEQRPGGISDVVKTPHFDRVAREGVLFTNAYVNAPSCTPCRSSLLSGQYFWRTGQGAILQGAVWDDKIPSYPLLLQDQGYHIGYTYKVWGPGTPTNAPYGAGKNSYGKRGGQFNSFSQFVSARDDIEAAKQVLYEQVRGNFQDFLGARKEGEPFCYWFGPTNCHRTWTQGSGKKLWGIDPDSLQGKLPKFLPDIPIVREDVADYLGEVQAFDAGLGVLLSELERIGELDNTLIVVSGDHGIPGMPRGKCNLYDLGTQVALAVRWGGAVPSGRVVEDFVCLPDLAPTFLEAAGVSRPDVMTAQSLLPVLRSEKSGQVDPTRDHVLIGRERHVAAAREGSLPYPQRAIRNSSYLYIRNFHPERAPMGDGPHIGKPDAEMPPYEKLRDRTFEAYSDLDASPTKAWIATHRQEPEMLPFFEFAFGYRPEEEMYDIRVDPDHLVNLARNPDYASQRRDLETQLFNELSATGDPRILEKNPRYESPPFTTSGPRR
ncbi:MAG: sulfatase [Planctomycetaceae bacterium]